MYITRGGSTFETGTGGFSGKVRGGDTVKVVFTANCTGVFSLSSYTANLGLLGGDPVAYEKAQREFDSATGTFDGGTTGNALTVKVPGDIGGGACTNKFNTEIDRFNNRYNGNGSATSPYASTCDGRPSANGNGGGGANGRPCQGCVGNADNKNPKGQAPNGTDANNGYECDGNNGVGKGNPAHTSCAGFQIDFYQAPVQRTLSGTGLPNQIQAQTGY